MGTELPKITQEVRGEKRIQWGSSAEKKKKKSNLRKNRHLTGNSAFKIINTQDVQDIHITILTIEGMWGKALGNSIR